MTATLVTSVGPARRCHVTEGAATSASFTTRPGPASRYVTSGLSRHVVSRPACHVTLCHVQPVTSRASLPSTNTHRPDLWPDAGPLAPSRLAASVVSMATSSVRSTVHSTRAHTYAHVRTDIHTDVYIYTYTHTRTRADSCTADIYWCCGCICQPVFPTHLLNFHLTDRQTVRLRDRRAGGQTDYLDDCIETARTLDTRTRHTRLRH